MSILRQLGECAVMPEVSVIVIIYKVERFLRQCLESLSSQTFKDIEVICVVADTDKACIEICEEFAGKDERFKVIKEAPRGTAGARNTGLSAAKGKYIAFVDGDDYAASDMIEVMHEGAVSQDADISVIGKYYVYENVTEAENVPASGNGGEPELLLIDPAQAMEIVLYQTGFFLHIWDKLYKRELFKDISFDEGKKVEDRLVSFRLLYSAERIVYNRKPEYCFRMSADSGSRVEDNLAKSFEADKVMCTGIMKKDPGLLKACEYFMAYEAMSVIQNSMLTGTFSREHDKEYLDYVRSLSHSVYNNKRVGRGVKAKTFLCLHFPSVLKWLTVRRRKKFLEGHRLFSSGNDWNGIFREQGIE